MTTSSRGFVGDLLIRAGVVDAAGLARGLEAQSRTADDAGTGAGRSRSRRRIRRRRGDRVGAASRVSRRRAARGRRRPSRRCCRPRSARSSGVAPLGVDGNVLRVAVTNPMDYSVLQDVEFRTGKKAVAVVVTQTWLETAAAPAATPRPIARRPTTCSTR